MPIKFVPTYVTEDGKSYDDIDKAIIHTRRIAVQHLLLDNRETLHLSLAEIDKAATVICAVQRQVKEVFDHDLKKEIDISAAKAQFADPGGNPVETKIVHEFDGTKVPPMKHEDIRVGGAAKDAFGALIRPGDSVRLTSTATEDDRAQWGPNIYRQAHDVFYSAGSDGDVVMIGPTPWPARGLVRKAA